MSYKIAFLPRPWKDLDEWKIAEIKSVTLMKLFPITIVYIVAL